MNPAIPVVMAMVGIGTTRASRRKRKNKGERQAEAKRSAQRQLSVLEVQSGVSFGRSQSRRPPAPADETNGRGTPLGRMFAGRRAAQPAEGQQGRPARPPMQPPMGRPAPRLDGAGDLSLFRKRIGGDIVLSEDGSQGYVGARWWAETGRQLFEQGAAQGAETPEQAAAMVLSAARDDIEWGAPEVPPGVHAVRQRVAHYIQAAQMSAPPVSAPPMGGMHSGPVGAEGTDAAPAPAAPPVEAEVVETAPPVQTKRKRRGSRGKKKGDAAGAESDGADAGVDAGTEASAEAGE